MAPHGEAVVTSYPARSNNKSFFTKPPRISNDNLQRTISDISFELMSSDIIDEELPAGSEIDNKATALPPISEVENAKCECCGMNEECTPEYISKIRDKFSGKWLCGLCSEAVKEERERGAKSQKEALEAHMSHCVRFNKLGRAFPVLCQAEAMRDLLKRSRSRGARAKSTSPKCHAVANKGGIARSSSCIPALARELD